MENNFQKTLLTSIVVGGLLFASNSLYALEKIDVSALKTQSIESIKKNHGKESFEYLYKTNSELGLDSEPDIFKYFSKVKVAYRKVDDFVESANTPLQAKQSVLLIKQLNKQSSNTVKRRTFTSLSRTLVEKSQDIKGLSDTTIIALQNSAAELHLKAKEVDEATQIWSNLVDKYGIDGEYAREMIKVYKNLVIYLDAQGKQSEANAYIAKINEMRVKSGPNKSIKTIRRFDPRYPMEAAKKGLQGAVELQYDIDANGRVQNIEVLKVEGHESFEQSAINALANWRYFPKLENAEPVFVTKQTVVMTFELDGM